MIKVLATREGLTGQTTATGWKITDEVPYVALPSRAALHQRVRVKNVLNGIECIAFILDIGPWNIDDDRYVFQPLTLQDISDPLVNTEVRPQAESGIDKSGRKTNHAGIDLGEYVWNTLKMQDNGLVLWEFV